MIAIVDYGMGNLRSVEKALHKLGHTATVTSDAAVMQSADRLILPGVGAFGAAIERLRRPRDVESLAESVLRFADTGRPLLGICLGMQLLLSRSEELGEHQGLGLVPGDVKRFDPAGDRAIKVPHMGWNAIRFPRESPLTVGVEPESQVYFVHSYYCAPADPNCWIAECRHGVAFCAALQVGNLLAAQFHPEKSGAVGLRMLDNFARWGA